MRLLTLTSLALTVVSAPVSAQQQIPQLDASSGVLFRAGFSAPPFANLCGTGMGGTPGQSTPQVSPFFVCATNGGGLTFSTSAKATATSVGAFASTTIGGTGCPVGTVWGTDCSPFSGQIFQPGDSYQAYGQGDLRTSVSAFGTSLSTTPTTINLWLQLDGSFSATGWSNVGGPLTGSTSLILIDTFGDQTGVKGSVSGRLGVPIAGFGNAQWDVISDETSTTQNGCVQDGLGFLCKTTTTETINGMVEITGIPLVGGSGVIVLELTAQASQTNGNHVAIGSFEGGPVAAGMATNFMNTGALVSAQAFDAHGNDVTDETSFVLASGEKLPGGNGYEIICRGRHNSQSPNRPAGAGCRKG